MKDKIVVLLSVLVLGLGSYLVYDKIIQEKQKPEVNVDQGKEENLNQVMKTLKKQVEESYVFKIMDKDNTEFDFTKENFSINKDNILAQTLTLLDEEEKYDSEGTWNVISIEKLNQHLKKAYGIDSLSTYPDMKLHGTNYKYDASAKKYTAKQEYSTDADPRGSVPDSIVETDIVKNGDEYVLTLATATIGDGFHGNFDKIYFDRYQTIEATFNVQKLEKEFCEETRCPLVQSEENRTILTGLLEEYVQKHKESIPYHYQFVFKKDHNGAFYITRFKTVKQ